VCGLIKTYLSRTNHILQECGYNEHVATHYCMSQCVYSTFHCFSYSWSVFRVFLSHADLMMYTFCKIRKMVIKTYQLMQHWAENEFLSSFNVLEDVCPLKVTSILDATEAVDIINQSLLHSYHFLYLQFLCWYLVKIWDPAIMLSPVPRSVRVLIS